MAEAISSEDSNSPEVQEDRKAAIKKFADAFETNMFSDVTLVVKGVEFPAHKTILSIQNDYFQKLFNNWKEEGANKITIDLDIEPDVFKLILEFIYKAQLSHRNQKLEAHAVNLIKAADMFGIDGLRRKCEKYIIRAQKIMVETACKYFILADIHNAPLLKETALKFISENLEAVKKTDGYKELTRHPTSTAGVVEVLSPSKRPRLSD